MYITIFLDFNCNILNPESKSGKHTPNAKRLWSLVIKVRKLSESGSI